MKRRRGPGGHRAGFLRYLPLSHRAAIAPHTFSLDEVLEFR